MLWPLIDPGNTDRNTLRGIFGVQTHCIKSQLVSNSQTHLPVAGAAQCHFACQTLQQTRGTKGGQCEPFNLSKQPVSRSSRNDLRALANTRANHRWQIKAEQPQTSHSGNGFVMTQDRAAICLLRWGRKATHCSDTQNISQGRATEEGRIWPVAQEVKHMSINGGFVDNRDIDPLTRGQITGFAW